MSVFPKAQPPRSAPQGSAPQVNPLADTQPTRPYSLADFQPIRVSPDMRLEPPRGRSGARRFVLFSLLAFGLLVCGGLYLLIPPQTNVLVLGVDDRTPGSAVGRSDTMILVTFQPAKRYIGMLSIPRDLWVQIPGYGENRINTAHFFAEAQQPGSGPLAAKAVIQTNFGVEMQYFIRFRFDSFVDFINTLGGVEITLAEPMAGLPAGVHRLDAAQTLAFVRDRQGVDDFSRLRKAQIILQAVITTALSPGSIPRWPAMAGAALNAVETDIPVYLWPKLGVIYLLAGSNNLDARIIEREMVQPFVTNQGAQVLLPRWDLIQPLILEMFGQ